ncbi:MAG TPA: ATP-binding protein [Ramlibacter sp.]|nr:ATP-binding protein [Ramlibacter sp.]
MSFPAPFASAQASCFDLADTAMAWIDPAGRMLRANPALHALLGRDMRGADVAWDWLHPEDRSTEQCRRTRLLLGKTQAEQREVRLVHTSGAILHARLHTHLVRDAQGQPCCFFDQLHDAAPDHELQTELEKARQGLRDTQAEHRREQQRADKEIVLLNNVMEQRIRKRTAELEQRNQDLRDFAYSLAHDLRGPLTSIDGFSAQLALQLDGRLEERSAHYLSRLRSGVRQMSELTDALLALADLSNAPLSHEQVDLSAVARTALERLAQTEPGRQVQLTIEDTPPAQGDARLLSHAMENLLGNAWKFSGHTQQARIGFSARPGPDGGWVYQVSDNGTGFDPGYAVKLFAPFQRLHGRAEFAGAGMGLAMVRKVVSRHGGRVWAESSPGAGAVFSFTLNERTPPAGSRPGGGDAGS